MIFQLISIVYSNNTKFIIYSLEKSGKRDGKLLVKSCCYESVTTYMDQAWKVLHCSLMRLRMLTPQCFS